MKNRRRKKNTFQIVRNEFPDDGHVYAVADGHLVDMLQLEFTHWIGFELQRCLKVFLILTLWDSVISVLIMETK